MNTKRLAGIAGIAALAVSACGGPSNSDEANGNDTSGGVLEHTGEVTVDVQAVPASMTCVAVTVTATTSITTNFTVTPGQAVATLALGPEPFGTLALTAKAYNVACSSVTASTVATWVADPLSITNVAGAIAAPVMTFRQNNGVSVTGNFVPDLASLFVGSGQVDAINADGTVDASGSIIDYYNTWTFNKLPSPFTAVKQMAGSSGQSFQCMLTTAGQVQCWGDNTYGELGNGTTTSSFSPVNVSLPAVQILKIAAGSLHACALDINGGVWCWGYNGTGQIGNGTTTNVLTPVQVFGAGAAGISLNGQNTCAAMGNGSVNCWGYNGFGQLGNNTTTNASSPVSVQGLTAANQVSVGADHACAVRGDGTVRCWGYNGYGQLGNGTFTQSLTPVVVSGLSNVTQILAGTFSNCARQSTGGVVCWGEDTNGELGDGKGTNVDLPQAVGGIPSAASIAGSGSTFCSIGTDLNVWCWGDNTFGQLGTGVRVNAWLPMRLTL